MKISICFNRGDSIISPDEFLITIDDKQVLQEHIRSIEKIDRIIDKQRLFGGCQWIRNEFTDNRTAMKRCNFWFEGIKIIHKEDFPYEIEWESMY